MTLLSIHVSTPSTLTTALTRTLSIPINLPSKHEYTGKPIYLKSFGAHFNTISSTTRPFKIELCAAGVTQETYHDKFTFYPNLIIPSTASFYYTPDLYLGNISHLDSITIIAIFYATPPNTNVITPTCFSLELYIDHEYM